MENTKLKNQLKHSIEQISKISDKEKIFDIIENTLKELTYSEFAKFLIYDSSKKLLYSNNSLSYDMSYPKGLLGISFLTKKYSIYNHIASEKAYEPSIDNPNNRKLRSQLIVPILKDDNIIAMVRLSRSIYYKTSHYSKKEIDIVNTLFEFCDKSIQKILSDKDTNYNIKIDSTKINNQISKIHKKRVNSDINSTMLFLSNTVHDIRTPANSLYGFLEILEAQIDDKRLKDYIINAKESALFINTLTDSILEQVKDTHQIESSRPEVITPIKFFAQIANIFSANMSKKDINYSVYICPYIPKEIEIDKLKLKRIIINLIGNAYKFTPSHKNIHFDVRCNKDKKELEIHIKDTGLGIDKSRQKAIFNSFEQAQEDTSEHFGGTGLGLAISSKYVKDLGGELKLISELDKGSTFYFNLPLKIINKEPSKEPFSNFNKKIVILTDKDKYKIDVDNIKFYLTKLEMPEEKIVVSDILEDKTTHLFCFEHKLSQEIIDKVKANNIKLVIIEEKLFSLSRNELYKDMNIISKNTYYGDKIYSSVFSGKKLKILIGDDNKINLVLLTAMLSSEYCSVDTAEDGEEILKKLKYAVEEEKKPYDIIFLDEHMPIISGSKLLNQFREIEKKYSLKPIFAISVTGDPSMSEEDKSYYDFEMNKPFKKQDVEESIKIFREKTKIN
ncbi:Sensory box histidine kinase/response regulator [hydrothermal vent metagenome]|uniref:histidine kinase n=1 Tax=hydrothermal vent metagenome TaxID=652676 RepID=A0A1W1ELH8_9ZZZZ